MVTATGEPRAQVPLVALETLWFNTGTLFNLACATCYIESSPTNDALIYLTADGATCFLDEIADGGFFATREIGFTGGEPFMNPEMVAMLERSLGRGHAVLVLTNAMRPMRRHEAALLDLRERYGDRLTLRVSLDHYSQAIHEAVARRAQLATRARRAALAVRGRLRDRGRRASSRRRSR